MINRFARNAVDRNLGPTLLPRSRIQLLVKSRFTPHVGSTLVAVLHILPQLQLAVGQHDLFPHYLPLRQIQPPFLKIQPLQVQLHS